MAFALAAFRSALYFVFLFVTIVPWATFAVAYSVFVRGARVYWVCAGWLRVATWGTRAICGVRARVQGRENLPDYPVVILPKHQSAWETFAFPTLMPQPLCYVFKRELLYIPFFGWAMARMDMIHIDRSRRSEAWSKVAEQGRRYMAQGNWMIMFPEGTRTPRGGQGVYKNGGTRLAVETGHAGAAGRGDLGALLAAQEPGAAAGRDRRLDRQADRLDRPRPGFADARGRGVDRGRDAPPRPGGVSVNGAIARGLRRIPDVLQRGLFDDAEEPLPAIAVAPAADPARHPRANRELLLDGRRIGFLLKRSRRRSIGFVVGAEGLAVSAPKWVALRDIEAAVREKQGWILAKLEEQRRREKAAAAGRIVWRDGTTLLYLGAPVIVTLGACPGRRRAQCARETPSSAVGRGATRRLHVGLPPGVAPEQLRDVVQSWLQREARRVFEARSAHFAARLGVRVTRLSLSSARTRWGSANATARSACTGG